MIALIWLPHRCRLARSGSSGSGRAWDAIDESKLGELNRMMASIPSPTGEERQLAQAIVGIMNASGIDGFYQPMDDDQGNAVGRIAGSRGRRGSLALRAVGYGIFQQRGRRMSVDRRSIAGRDDDAMRRCATAMSSAMGAENPKGYAACVVAAAQAIKAAGCAAQGFAHGRLGLRRNADQPAAKFHENSMPVKAPVVHLCWLRACAVISRSSPNRAGRWLGKRWDCVGSK